MISKWSGYNKEDARYRRIPERVLNAISAQQEASEKLVGWVQMAVVIFFGLLYAVSPKTFARDLTFEPVPWFLGIWLVITIIRLFLAYRYRISAPLLYLSIIIDMSLLLGMIWSFHLQYQQPPSFYLKSPTLLYVFIFIALRALRFEARYVITAGVVAAIGWSAMAVYATLASGGMEVVTRDYVYYLTSNSVLKGAELDKVITILTVTAIISVAITRAHKLLVKAVAEGAAAHDLSRFFSPEIASQITTAEQAITAGSGKTRDAAILMVDIRGFTRLSSIIKPDDLVCLLAEYQSRIVPIIQRHGGTIDKFMGDGIMGTFGAAVTSPTYAADALKAVDDIMESATVWSTELENENKPPLKLGAAVATGRIIFGAVGDESRMEYTVIGDAVNLAAKLEKHTKSEGVRALCTEAAFDIAIRQGYQPPENREQRKARSIEGVDNPVDIVILTP
ncbi:MAG: adenylate/guanylate cyclase domain-containing protein [Desulfobacterales bacterium]|jgi:adenylate cyclase